VVAKGAAVRLEVGQTVGVGWNSASCGMCQDCLAGDDNMCAEVQGVIVGRHGGFADRLRVSERFAVPVPDSLDPAISGPLLCGGVTVYNPLKQLHVRPSERVGVVGVGGLGHMALQFAKAWGCEVTAFSTSADKEEESRRMGAHRFVGTRDPAALQDLTRSLDVLLVTVNVPLDWEAYINTLRPRGRLVIVGAVLEPMQIPAFPLILGQRSVVGSPNGSAHTTAEMLQFAARHGIQPVTQQFPLAEVNEALDVLRQNRARYRLVLKM
jgi:alcohol/geraniol dehydrogenase (NADP+)